MDYEYFESLGGVIFMKASRTTLYIFVIMTLASGWVGVLVDSMLSEQPEGDSLGMGVWLIFPLLTTILLRIFSDGWKDTGIKPYFICNWKWYLLAIAVYPLATAICIGIAYSLKSIEITGHSSYTFVFVALASLLGSMLKNIFEEFAWRGYLTPKLIGQGWNDWLIYLISGIIWASWHIPYYLVFLPDTFFSDISRIGMIGISTVLMICWSIMYVEIYRITKSVWPCILLHTVEDAFPTVLMTGDYIVFTKNSDIWLNPINGIVPTVIIIVIGLWLRSIRKKK